MIGYFILAVILSEIGITYGFVWFVWGIGFTFKLLEFICNCFGG